MDYINENSIGNMRGSGLRVEIITLVLVLICLFVILDMVRRRTVRIYNWTGKRFRYLGRARLHRDGGGYRVRIGERMSDLSCTTLYQLCPPKGFVRKNRYKAMALCAGRERRLLYVDGCMRQSIYYRGQ